MSKFKNKKAWWWGLLLILGILFIFCFGGVTLQKIKYIISIREAKKSTYQNYANNQANIQKLYERLQEVQTDFSISLFENNIVIEEPMDSIEQLNYYLESYSTHTHIKPLYRLKDLIRDSKHFTYSKMKNFNLSFKNCTEFKFKQLLETKFPEGEEGFLEILNLLDNIDCIKIIKQNECVQILHKRISRFDDPFCRIYCLHYTEEEILVNFGFQMGKCELDFDTLIKHSTYRLLNKK